MITQILFALITLASAATTPKPEELLKTSDRSRGAAASLEGVSWDSQLTSVEGGVESQTTYAVKVRGVNALAETLSPPRQKGELVLFNDRTLWYYKPGLKKPVSISPRQKLMGQAANGDIASTNYARDYDATSIEAQTLDGLATWKLELKAKSKNVTYDRIRYWISQAQKVAVKAEFLTLAGEPFKSAEFKYGNQVKMSGQSYMFISEMRIRDANNKDNITTLVYTNPRAEAHAPGLFNVNNLIK
jgi:outer membrane lipoprotein-sorting protein